MTTSDPAPIPSRRVGFVGLGVMGWPMCRHIHDKRESVGVAEVVAFDAVPAALERARAHGIATARTLSELADRCDAIHLCLPGGAELEALIYGEAGLITAVRPGQIVIDHGTSPVPLTRRIAVDMAQSSVEFVDAPIARTRAAAEAGTLVVMVGSGIDVIDRIRPQVSCFAEEIVPCGGIGSGQVVKQLNNMVLFQTVVALGEALATARAAGVDGDVLFAAMSQGSGDSFALRNHGMKAMLPGAFPERAFPTTYALKDLAYAIELASASGLDLKQAATTRSLLEAAVDDGNGARYFPVVLETIARGP